MFGLAAIAATSIPKRPSSMIPTRPSFGILLPSLNDLNAGFGQGTTPAIAALSIQTFTFEVRHRSESSVALQYSTVQSGSPCIQMTALIAQKRTHPRCAGILSAVFFFKFPNSVVQ